MMKYAEKLLFGVCAISMAQSIPEWMGVVAPDPGIANLVLTVASALIVTLWFTIIDWCFEQAKKK